MRDYGVDGQIGLEKTPEEYVERLVEIFREVKRVSRPDSTLWLNLGDSYATSGGSVGRCLGGGEQGERFLRQGHINTQPNRMPIAGLKPKDLVGIPWAIAKALRGPYYAGRIQQELDRVWIAATLDAEGTICGFSHDRKDDGRTRTGVHVTITNTSTLMLDHAQAIWPASRSEHERHGEGHLGDLDSYRWIIHGIANKIQFLREIYPYLIVKRRQALVAYNLLLLMADAKRMGKGLQGVSVREKRATMVRWLSDLNKGRPCDLPSWLLEPPSVLEDGWYLRSDIIWSKPNPMPESVTDRPTKSHEYIFLLSKSERYYYNADAIKEPAIEGNDLGLLRTKAPAPSAYVAWHAKSIPDRQEAGADSRSAGNGLRNKRSVWTVTTQPYSEAHFATFPTEIPRLCILAGTNAGDTVLDPFSGSGTTSKVAIELGRKAIAIEPKLEYVRMIEQRCRTTIGLPLS